MPEMKEKLSASLEDYLEAIYNLEKDKGAARSKDIADALNVARPSVTAALQGLSEKKLINYKPYGKISLTEKGCKRAERIAEKHDVIKSFFIDVLGIENSSAHEAACKAEHILGADIVSRIIDFKDFIESLKEEGQLIPENFKEYCHRKSE